MNPAQPAESELHKLWYVVADHQLLPPALGVLALALLVWGILRATRGNRAALEQRQARKDEIVRRMRKLLSVSADSIAAELHIDRLEAGALLEELVGEGKLVEQRQAGGLASYRLKGL